jgi:FKBP-type peptidyl-prolyl cis-trans isomerase SlyD
LEYTLKDADGGILDSNKGRDPLVFTHGQGQIVPGLEQALTGMRTGEEKHVTVKPEDAYGMENPAAVTEVPKEIIPANALKVGAGLVARNQTGETRLVKVKEIKEKSVVLDLNHPLAGKTLFFDVKILGVDAPKAGPPKE